MSKITKERYKKLISKGDIETGELIKMLLEDLIQYLNYDPKSVIKKIQKEVIILSSNWNNVKNEDRIGIIESDKSQSKKNRIQTALVECINELPDYYFIYLNANHKEQNSVKKEKAVVRGDWFDRNNILKVILVTLLLILAIVFIPKLFLEEEKAGITNEFNNGIENERVKKEGDLILNTSLNSFSIIQALEKNMEPITGGIFTMGCTSEQEDCSDTEKPSHKVSIPSFKMNRFEVTQREWRAIMEYNPSKFVGCDSCPVENVSWDNIQEFLRKLNKITRKNYRLPREAEWEYAARGGEKYKYVGSDNIDDIAWYRGNSNNTTHPVGNKEPNKNRLFDMSGNVWELCEDIWHGNYEGAPNDGSARKGEGYLRVRRGGSWKSNTKGNRGFIRGKFNQKYINNDIGFRLAHD